MESIEALGFRKPEKNAQTEHVMLTVDLAVKNATFLKKGTEYDYTHLVSMSPGFWGVKTPANPNPIMYQAKSYCQYSKMMRIISFFNGKILL
ncbi:hypothetical protein [Paenibacillus plantiphilus]|uniref:hypothetical protein n=1 Tax=Paenibacillus plantiphilus TaxID=2905650 RepID=UPI001F30E51E|nr:hypothetical protein [Paenibacillus plantiphilus]